MRLISFLQIVVVLFWRLSTKITEHPYALSALVVERGLGVLLSFKNTPTAESADMKFQHEKVS